MTSKRLSMFTIFCASLVLLSSCVNVLPISKVNALPNTIMSVEPQRNGVNPSDIFQIDVNITDVEFLYGFEFKIFYNMYVLTALDLEPGPASNNGPGFFFSNETGQGWKVWKWQLDNSDLYGNGTGIVWLSLTRPLSVLEGLSGSGRLGRITFSADNLGVSALTFALDILGDQLAQPIDHTIREGMVVVGYPPAASFTYSPANPPIGDNVTFDASTSTGFDGSTAQGLVANWEFGDGTNGTGIVTTHTYSAAGTYTANLTVIDPINRTAFTTDSIAVTSIPPTLLLAPDFGPAGTTVHVDASGFKPLSLIVLSFDDMQLTEILTDAGGKFTANISIPLSEGGRHFIKAWYDNRTAFAQVPFTVVDMTPLDVNVDVGAIHFRGEIAEFYVDTTFNGKLVDADIKSAILYYSDGAKSFNLTANIAHIATGLYRIPYTIPSNPTEAPIGTYVLVVEAQYFPDPSLVNEFADCAGASFKSFLLSGQLTGWDNLLISINGAIGTINTNVGLITVDLSSINAKISSIQGDVTTITTDIGTIQTDTSNIDARITAMDGDVATIKTAIQSINGNITSIKGNLATIQTTVGSIKTTVEGWSGTVTSITRPEGIFKMLSLTTSNFVGSPVYSDNLFTLTLSGDGGTQGITNIVLPKQLLQSIGSSVDKVAMTINDQATVFTYKEGPSAYVLHVTYTHSTATIKVYLTGAITTPFPLSTIIIIAIAVTVAAAIIFYVWRRRKP